MRFNKARVMKRAWNAYRSPRTSFFTFAAALKWSWKVERRERYPFEIISLSGFKRTRITAGRFSDGTLLFRSRQGQLLNTGGLSLKWHREARRLGKDHYQQGRSRTAWRVA